MKKLLITGASGMLGRALIKHCSSRFETCGTYFTRNYKPENCVLKQLDLNNPAEIEACLNEFHPEIVIHTAGLTNIQYCQKHRQEAEDINYRATAQLAAFCAQRAIRLVNISSDMVFDGQKGGYNEEEALNPLNFYGKGKSLAEETVKSICENYVIARINLIYGHCESRKKTFSDRILIANWSGRPYTVYKGQVRSPISLDVASRAVRELAEGDFIGIYHLGGLESVDRWDLALKLISFLRLEPTIVEETIVPPELADIYPINTSYDTKKAATELKTELLTIEEGLKLEYGKYIM